MLIELGYGVVKQSVIVDEQNILDILMPNIVEYDLTDESEVRRAMNNPIGSTMLKDKLKPGESVAIVTSDITRPLPSYIILPPLLEELEQAGIRRADIVIVFALGSHRTHTRDEMIKLVGQDIYDHYRCIDGDKSDCIHLGQTSRGTPVDIVRAVAEVDRRICLGNIEFHYFAGYSGGAKAIMPGVSTREAIAANHSMMVMEQAKAGNMESNPLRQDLEEGASMCGVDYIINVVLDENKRIIKAVAGDLVKAHRKGCEFLDKLYLKKISKKADIVIVSQGGYPKDINLYQTQKALDNAKHAIRDGGIIILVGACTEGFGEEVFEQWIKESDSYHDLIDRVKIDFQLGGHKAAAIAMVLDKSRIFLVSDMPDDVVRECYMEPYHNLKEAYNEAYAIMIARKKVGDISVLIMPYGGSTLPRVCEE